MAAASWSQSESPPAGPDKIIFEVIETGPTGQREDAAVVSGVFEPTSESRDFVKEWAKDKLRHPQTTKEIGEFVHEAFEVACEKTKYGLQVSASEIKRIADKLRGRGILEGEVQRIVKPLSRPTNLAGAFVRVVVSESLDTGTKFMIEHPPRPDEGYAADRRGLFRELKLKEVRPEQPEP
jgi:hypothetical protein